MIRGWWLGFAMMVGCAGTPEKPALEPCRVSKILDQQLPPAMTLVESEPTGEKLEDLRAYRLSLSRRHQRVEQVRYLVGITHGQHPDIKVAYYAFLNAEVEFVRAKRIQIDIEIANEEDKKSDNRVELQKKRVATLERQARVAQDAYEAARSKCP